MKKSILLASLIGIANLFFGFSPLHSIAQNTFVHISDLHVSDAVSYVNDCDNGAVMFQCYIKKFTELNPKPAFIVASGDITNLGNCSPYGMYPMLTQYLYPGLVLNPGIGDYYIDSARTIPIYFVPGNHDYRTGNIPPLSNATLPYYSKYIAPDTDYVVTTTDAVIIFLRSGYDDNRPIWEDTNPLNPEGSGLTGAQCNWLRNVLSLYSSKRKIIVMHHPPVDVAGTNPDGTPFTSSIQDMADGSILNNRTTFMNICDSNHVDVVLAGHEHQNVVASRSGNVVAENWPDSTRYIQTGAAFQGAYRIITVSSSFVNVGVPMISCPSGVNELNDPINISIYPNPVTNSLTIEAPQKTIIEIRNIQGQIIKTVNTTEKQTSIDIANLSDGVYIIKVKTEKGTAVKKFIKE